MIRLMILFSFLVLFLILSLPLLGIEYLLGKLDRYSSDLRQLRFIQFGFKCMIWICGTKLTVIGEENVPKDQTVLYICNHRSFFDTVITYARCPTLTGYISKESMKKVPIFSSWMKRLYCMFLNRENVRQGLQVILTAIDLIKNNISVFVYPEGKRNKECDKMLEFHSGSFKIATKTGCPIIPMSITNSSDIFEDHFPYIRPAHVILEYGKPIHPDTLSKEELKKLGEYCHTVVEEMYERNKLLIPTKKA